jgi:hypothetical protein
MNLGPGLRWGSGVRLVWGEVPACLTKAVEEWREWRMDMVCSNKRAVSIRSMVSKVAKNLSALRTDAMLRDRAGRADLDWFDRFMSRAGGETPTRDDTP